MGPRELIGVYSFESPLHVGSFTSLKEEGTSSDQVHRKVLRLKLAFWEVETYTDFSSIILLS